MQAMILEQSGRPLHLRNVARPIPGPGEVLIRVLACGVCHTDLHIIAGELAASKLPLILGHQIIGEIAERSAGAMRFQVGNRVGVPWLGKTCQVCAYCQKGQENLCDAPLFTGYTRDGGFAEYAVANEAFCFAVPNRYEPAEAAPLLCAGLIGYRSYRLAGAGVERLGIYGFGAAAHILAQIAVYQGKKVYAFTRPGDRTAQEFALQLGAFWAGDSTESPPETLDAALIFAPVGFLVPAALRAVRKGGTVVCGGIHMSDIPSFPYRILWEERCLRSVANLTRQDGDELLALAPQIPLKTSVTPFPLSRANEAIEQLKRGQIEGAAVVVIDRNA
ncbi:MAG: zinc-dependent alcohol dehydrogenase family protein [Acidobacteriota bacterium]